jgi:site-specific recombinase XerD
MNENTKLEETLQLTLESLREKQYSRESLRRYRIKFNGIIKHARHMGITDVTEELLQTYIDDDKNVYTGEFSILKQRQHIRTANLIRSYANNGEVDTSRKKGKVASDLVINDSYIKVLDTYVVELNNKGLSDNTICSYKRIVSYFLIFCQNQHYEFLTDVKTGDVHDFIMYIYDHGYFKPTTVSSALSGLRHFLLAHESLRSFAIELPTHLPRECKIIEVYDCEEKESIDRVFYGSVMTKRDHAICLLLMETGIRAVDICNLKLKDIDWHKDIIYITQQKTGKPINLPLRNSYGNAIADYLINERPKSPAEYVFIRRLAPFDKLEGDGSTIREILLKLESFAKIDSSKRMSGSRMIRHNAASSLLKAGVAMSDISAILGHSDPNVVSVYLSTDSKTLSECTLPIPGKGGINND